MIVLTHTSTSGFELPAPEDDDGSAPLVVRLKGSGAEGAVAPPETLECDVFLAAMGRTPSCGDLAVEEAGPNKGTELWRISLRLGALNDVDYGEFVSSLRAAVEPVVAAYRCRQEVLRTVLDNVDSIDERFVGDTLILGYSPKHEQQVEREQN